MSAKNWARLIALGAIWGVVFIFLRIAAPALGALLTAEVRVLTAAVVLVIAAAAFGQRLDWRANWRTYLAIGALNSATPFALFAFAAKLVPAGYLAIINGTVAFFGALFAALMVDEPFTRRKIAGSLLGIVGIACLVQLSPLELNVLNVAAIAAALGACAAWGIGGALIKRRSLKLPPIAFAAGTQCGAALVLAPIWASWPPPGPLGPNVWIAALAAGVLCTGVAYLLYFGLLREIGAGPAATSTLLVPLFGALFGWAFLGEPITLSMVVGGAIIVLAMGLALDLRPAPAKA